MSPLRYNIFLALSWAAVTGSFTLANLIFGFAIGAMAIMLVRDQIGAPNYLRRVRGILSLIFLFMTELALSSWRVARLVVSPRMAIRPGIFAFPLTTDSDAEITLLANLITLTPGTLSVDVSEDRKTLFVHALDCSDPDRLRHDIASGFERKIMEALR